jgi:hypothetical protein
MSDFPASVWFLIAIAGGGGILAMLNYLASSVRNQQIVHDFRVEIQQLQSNYLRILREQKEKELHSATIETPKSRKRAA